MNDGGRAAVVLDTGALTRGSGSKKEEKERNIRKWFVERNLIEGIIQLPENLFYNTTAAGVIIVVSKRRVAARQDSIVMLNASRRFAKGKPKNHIEEVDVAALAQQFLAAAPAAGELEVVSLDLIRDSDYNLSPARWVPQSEETKHRAVDEILTEIDELDRAVRTTDSALRQLLLHI
jgi:type I restriction enzyme M protein